MKGSSTVMISAVILTKNEEDNIEDCIKSLRFCDEVVVIDDESSDSTIKLAESLGAIVYEHPLDNDFAAQHNYGAQKAKNKWILSIDADERVSRDLAIEITQIVNDLILPYSGFSMKRIDEMWGKRILHGECGNIRLLRLVKKGSGEWRRAVHETYVSKEKTYELKNPLMHYPHQTLREFIADVDRMSTIHAKANNAEKKQSNIFKIVFFPPLKFIWNYFFKLGFKDGTQGFMIAAVMSFHSYLAWSKLWLMQKSEA